MKIKNVDAQSFLNTMITPVRQCGLVALALQNTIVDIGKEVESRDNDSKLLEKKRSAKTLIDVIIQEMLLLSASTLIYDNSIGLDAEEDSRFTNLFADKSSTISIIIDPIDGTLEYIEQKENFSICVGMRVGDKMESCIVFFPKRDLLFYSDSSQAYVVKGFLEDGLKNKAPLSPCGTPKNQIYINKRVPAEVVQRLQANGYDVIDDEVDNLGAPDAILACVHGSAIGYLSHTRQVRDILLGDIVGKMTNGFAIDWFGRPLSWPRAPRLDRAFFGCGTVPDKVLNCTRGL